MKSILLSVTLTLTRFASVSSNRHNLINRRIAEVNRKDMPFCGNCPKVGMQGLRSLKSHAVAINSQRLSSLSCFTLLANGGGMDTANVRNPSGKSTFLVPMTP